jgi:chitinase
MRTSLALVILELASLWFNLWFASTPPAPEAPRMAAAAAAQSTAPAHSVVVSWTASPDAAANPTLTYNVYRGPGTCLTTTTFTKLTASPISTLTYTDTNVTIGSWYCYASTAVLNGVESAPSANEGGTATPIPVSASTTIVIVSH